MSGNNYEKNSYTFIGSAALTKNICVIVDILSIAISNEFSRERNKKLNTRAKASTPKAPVATGPISTESCASKL
jgi:hypothetical protein